MVSDPFMAYSARCSTGIHLAAIALAVVAFSDSLASAGVPIAISLSDGRILTGEVDSRTSDSELWLHSAEPSILILSSTPWSDVTAARIADTTLTTEEFRKRIDLLKTPAPTQHFQRRVKAVPEAFQAVTPIVQSIEIVPELANWKRGVAPDGLEIRVRSLAVDRHPVVAEGIVTVRLLGRRFGFNDRLQSPVAFGFWNDGGTIREYTSRLNSSRYIELGRWSERLSKKDAIGSEYVLRLPFRNVNPEFDLDVALDGIVTARWSVDGQSVHETSTPLQLRTFSPFREELQRERGSRFFPDES